MLRHFIVTIDDERYPYPDSASIDIDDITNAILEAVEGGSSEHTQLINVGPFGKPVRQHYRLGIIVREL